MLRRLLALVIALLGVGSARAATPQVEFQSQAGAFPIVDEKIIADIYCDPADVQPTAIVAQLLADDIRRVSDRSPKIIHDPAQLGRTAILIGTLGHSHVIDKLASTGSLHVAQVRGRWETYAIEIVEHPLPNVDRALVIVGSDRRGTAYGVTTLSKLIGVSPWYWWANVPPQHHDTICITAEHYTDGPPGVKYRGIFLNDEAPAMSGWAKQQFGGFNSKMYVHVFELMLRLKANYLWPAMWGEAFNEDDPENPKLANDYGIVMGTSHQEPMMRAQTEWDRRHNGANWNFAKDPEGMEQFWREGIKRNKNYDNLITLGMRGRNDTPMIENATIEQSIDLLQKIVAVQRKIIADEINPDVAQVPQMWCLYKEVQSYYEHGLRVPDDVTLLWSDDNWGNLRRLPTDVERNRAGGAGIYYHFDYVGDPRSYKWINTTQIAKVWEQMSLADAYGANRIWIVNVGDLKPLEYPIDFFMTMAWNPKAMTSEKLNSFPSAWASQQFGPEHAKEIADLLSWYTRMNARRKPELLTDLPYSVENYHEADTVLAECRERTAQADALAEKLPPEMRDAYFQLVQHPVKATSVVNQLYIRTAQNHLYAKQGRASANAAAEDVDRLFKEDAALSDQYNHAIAGGFWNHMMDQTHIGYTSWRDPETNVRPAVQRVPADHETTEAQAVSKPAAPAKEITQCFAEDAGVVSILAEHYTQRIDTPSARWAKIDDYGLFGTAMYTAPPTSPSILTPVNAPQLEYKFFTTTASSATVTTFISPTQAFVPGRGLRYAISIDDEPPQIIDTLADRSHPAWQASVRNGVRRCSSKHGQLSPGYHTLHLFMVDPALVLQKIVINLGGERAGYLGPPESCHQSFSH